MRQRRASTSVLKATRIVPKRGASWGHKGTDALVQFFVAKLAATFMGGAALRERRLECRWTSGGGSIGDAKRWLG